jgi:predicted nucleotide-binding protein (sugar kinase/HSP70/actin superfamily)
MFRDKIFIEKTFTPAKIEFTEPIATYISSNGECIPLTDKRVLVLIPAMNDITSRLFASAFRSCGINSVALDIHTSETLKYGRANASGKECLPIILMAGNLLYYIKNQWDGKKHLVYFQVQGAGNCRLGQYPVFLSQMIEQLKLPNVTQMVLMNEDGFAGLGNEWSLRAVQALIISDVLEDIRSGIMAYAVDSENGIEIFDEEFNKLENDFANNPKEIYNLIEKFALSIKNRVSAKDIPANFKQIAMIGEIFCRKDVFAHKWLNKYFAENGFVLKIAYISEWITYIDYLISIDLLESDKSINKRFERMLRNFFMKDAEKKIKKTLAKSGYYDFERMNVEPALSHSKHIIPLEYKGEPGLTLGIALNDSFEKYCGIINFGPFGCMPTRFAEAICVPEMKVKYKNIAKKKNNPKYVANHNLDNEMDIPFLTIESDGNPFSQLIEARLETFIMQANRAFEKTKTKC